MFAERGGDAARQVRLAAGVVGKCIKDSECRRSDPDSEPHQCRGFCLSERASGAASRRKASRSISRPGLASSRTHNPTVRFTSMTSRSLSAS